MRVNPIVFYEVLLNSTIDKVFEFNDVAIFYNIVIPSWDDNVEKNVILKMVKKNIVMSRICMPFVPAIKLIYKLLPNWLVLSKNLWNGGEMQPQVGDRKSVV